MTKRLERYFKDYASYHKTSGNKVTHYFGISFILISLLGLLSQWRFGNEIQFANFSLQPDAATLLLGMGIVWYLFLDWKIAAPFSLVLIGLYFLGKAIPTWLNGALFIGGWILQGVGHYIYEKNSPAFYKNLTHLMIGPLWIFARFVGYLPRN
jgi:uncharacterized membrane protein YGL010W